MIQYQHSLRKLTVTVDVRLSNTMVSIFNLYYIVLVTVISFNAHFCQNCNYIKNISLAVTTRSGDGSSLTQDISQYTGCFMPEKLTGNVEEIVVLDQEIFSLEKRSINGMRELKKLIFVGCEISQILPGAFHEAPNLRILHIRNGNLKTIDAGIFNVIPTIEELNFEVNDISSIDDHAFANLPLLKQIILSHNELDGINSNWFSNTNNIEHIDLTYNNLQKIQESTFKGLPKLKKVILDFNDIENIEEGTFKQFKEMQHLGLSHNRLRQLDANIVPNEMFIERLFLNVNFLNFLPQEFLKMVKVQEISLEGNPWNCECLNIIHSWMLDNNCFLNVTQLCSRTDVPQCINSQDSFSHCDERVDEHLTEVYISTLKSLIPRVDDSCARFD